MHHSNECRRIAGWCGSVCFGRITHQECIYFSCESVCCHGDCHGDPECHHLDQMQLIMAPHCRQVTMPAPCQPISTGYWMLFVMLSQQCQSTEGRRMMNIWWFVITILKSQWCGRCSTKCCFIHSLCHGVDLNEQSAVKTAHTWLHISVHDCCTHYVREFW